jgi:hypothetical protein
VVASPRSHDCRVFVCTPFCHNRDCQAMINVLHILRTTGSHKSVSVCKMLQDLFFPTFFFFPRCFHEKVTLKLRKFLEYKPPCHQLIFTCTFMRLCACIVQTKSVMRALLFRNEKACQALTWMIHDIYVVNSWAFA